MSVTKIDPKKYKLAKKFCKDLEMVLKAMDLSIRALNPFLVYKSVAKVSAVLKEEKAYLEIHYKKQKSILDNKGVE